MFLACNVLSNENSYLFHVKRSLEFESLGLLEQYSDAIKVLGSFYTVALPLVLFIEYLFLLQVFMEYLLCVRTSYTWFWIFELFFHLGVYCLMIVREFLPLLYITITFKNRKLGGAETKDHFFRKLCSFITRRKLSCKHQENQIESKRWKVKKK